LVELAATNPSLTIKSRGGYFAPEK
jgi:hypothetical protein